MSNFSFGNISVSSKKYALNLETYDNPLLVDKSSFASDYKYPIVFLVEKQYSEKDMKGFDKFLRKLNCTRYIVLNAINCEYNEKEVKDGIIKFFKTNKSKFFDFIPQNAPIVTSGSALYTLLQEDDIYPNHINQCIFGRTNFWFSENLTTKTCHRVYPMESLDDLFCNGFDKGAIDSFKTKIAQIQINKAINNNNMLPPRYPKLNKIFIESSEDFNNRFYLPNKDRHDEVLAWDLETSGLDFFYDRIGCITLSFDGVTGYYIPWKYVDKNKLGEILEKNIQLGANIKFDVKFLWKNGVPQARVDEDVILMGHTLDEERSNSLKALAFYYSEYGGYERPLDIYKEKMGGEKINYLEIPEETLRDYAVMDAIVTKRVWNNLIAHMRELDEKYPNEFYNGSGLEHYYYTYRIPASRMYSKIEYNGVYVDKEKLNQVRMDMYKAIDDLKAKLCKEFGVPSDFQWESGKKLGILLENKGWEDFGRTKSGELATGDFQFSRWEKNHPEAKDIVQLKSYKTLLNTFVGDTEFSEHGWASCLHYHEEDDSYRMHPVFQAMMADSGRSRCNNPNMQQVPTRGKFTKEIKSCIETPNNDDYYLVTVDYSSLQMRLACIDYDKHDSLKDVFNMPNADVHSQTGFNTFCKGKKMDVEIIEVEQDGKTFTFLGGETILTENRGEILAKDLTEEDTLLIE